MRVVAAVVLGSYLAALGAATTGHGLRLALHLLAEHHEAHEHGADHHGHDTDHHDDAGDDRDAPHAHHGRVHTHHEEPPPAWLSVSLDTHVGPPDHRMPLLRLIRSADVPGPSASPAAVVMAVEVPPPRREA